MGRYYIDRVKIPSASAPFEIPSEKRQKKWAEETEKYGFSSKDTWSLHETMLELLYERLCLYLEIADQHIDLTYYKFMFEGKEYDRKQLIEMMIENAEKYFFIEYEFDGDSYTAEKELEAVEAKNKVWRIWAIVEDKMSW